MVTDFNSLPKEIKEYLIMFLFPSKGKVESKKSYRHLFRFSLTALSNNKMVKNSLYWKVILDSFIKKYFLMTDNIDYLKGFEESPFVFLKMILLNNVRFTKELKALFDVDDKGYKVEKHHSQKLRDLSKTLTDALKKSPDNPILLTLLSEILFFLNDYTGLFINGIKAIQKGIFNNIGLLILAYEDPKKNVFKDTRPSYRYRAIDITSIEAQLRALGEDATFDNFISTIKMKWKLLTFEKFVAEKKLPIFSNRFIFLVFKPIVYPKKDNDKVDKCAFDDAPPDTPKLILSSEEEEKIMDLFKNRSVGTLTHYPSLTSYKLEPSFNI